MKVSKPNALLALIGLSLALLIITIFIGVLIYQGKSGWGWLIFLDIVTTAFIHDVSLSTRE